MSTMEVGYYTEPGQTDPAHDVGLDVDCPVCNEPLDYPRIMCKTVCAMDAEERDLSFFFRPHKSCWIALSDEEQGVFIDTAAQAARAHRAAA